MLPADITTYFSRPADKFLFQRWDAPIVPQVFGTAAPDPALILTAMKKVAAISGHDLVTSPSGAGMNCTIWFVKEWTDIMKLPGTEMLLGSLGVIVKLLSKKKGNMQRSIDTDPKTGAISRMVVTIRRAGPWAEWSDEHIALRLAVQTHLRWGYGKTLPALLVKDADGSWSIAPAVEQILKVAYDPSLPLRSEDPALADKLADLTAA